MKIISTFPNRKHGSRHLKSVRFSPNAFLGISRAPVPAFPNAYNDLTHSGGSFYGGDMRTNAFIPIFVKRH